MQVFSFSFNCFTFSLSHSITYWRYTISKQTRRDVKCVSSCIYFFFKKSKQCGREREKRAENKKIAKKYKIFYNHSIQLLFILLLKVIPVRQTYKIKNKTNIWSSLDSRVPFLIQIIKYLLSGDKLIYFIIIGLEHCSQSVFEFKSEN